MLGETVDKQFTMVSDVAEVAADAGGLQTNALTGESIIVSHGWHNELTRVSIGSD